MPDVKLLKELVVALAHGDNVSYPLALIHVQMEMHALELEVVVLSTVPELESLLGIGQQNSV